MGIVIRQSFWGSVFAYMGVAIGYLNTLYLRPKYLDPEQIGLLNIVVNNALLMAPFVCLGMPATLVRYYPHVEKNEVKRKEFLSNQIYLIFFANIAAALLLFLFIDEIKSIFETKSAMYNEYIFLSLIILASQSFFIQFQSYSRVVLDVLVPAILKDIYLRISYALIICLYAIDLIDFAGCVRGLVALYVSATVLETIHVLVNQKFRMTMFSWISMKKWIGETWNYSIYNLAASAGNSIYTNISFLLITTLIGLESNGIFTTCFYIGIIIELPNRAVLMITAPVVSREFKNKNYTEIENLYQRSSLTLGSIGFLFLIGIVCNIEDLFLVIPNGKVFSQGLYVVMAISFAKVFDMLFGLNGNILAYSEHYRVNVYFLLLSVAVLCILNLTLLPTIGINGAGIAFLVSTILFNLLKHYYIVRHLKISLFTKNHIWLLLIGFGTMLLFYFVSIWESPVLNIMGKSALISVFYGMLIYKFNISRDTNSFVKSILKKYLNIKI
ncbi:MAG: polysaccharide biosynthesis C-terminal domain-containing protein [Marinoscillum sp.]|uniref:lipopolysaccharide biosynthesis protein n=1 Tax=Marinoscillum sp. TaxID=2024838 RepID=UPI0032F6502D